MSRPLLLDLFCGAGGAARGYHDAGFDVIGVDIVPQPRYPYEFHQADALSILRTMVDYPNFSGELWRPTTYAAIHASPPCQAYSAANNIHGRDDHPMLIAAVRELLIKTGLPYVIENVDGARAHMRNPAVVCGLAFPELNVRRHRLFECSFPVMIPPCGDHRRRYLIVFGQGAARTRARQIGRTPNDGPILRRGTASWKASCEAMGIHWMKRPELSEAIPPAYTQLIGEQLLVAIKVGAS